MRAKSIQLLHQKKNALLIVLLLVVFVFQAYSIWTVRAHLQLYFLKTYGTIQSVERSEILAMGYNEAKYLRFLDAVIPESAALVLPPGSSGWFVQQNILQYYLFPRIIWPCTDTCRDHVEDPSSFIMALDGFPPEELRAGKTIIPFPETGRFDGVYAPAGQAERVLEEGLPAYEELSRIPIQAPFMDLIVLLLGSSLGFLLAHLLLEGRDWIVPGILGMPLGFGFLTWVIFVTNYLGWPVTLVHVAILFAILLSLATGFLFLRRKHPDLQSEVQPGMRIKKLLQDPIQLIIGLAFLGWFGMIVLISISRTYSAIDDIANWALKGYAIAHQGSIWAGQTWGGHGMAYPMNLQLSIAIFDLASGDLLPGSKILFPLYAIVLLISCLRFLLRHGVKARTGMAAMLVLISMPLFYHHSTLGMANLPFTALLVMAILTQLEALEESHAGKQILAGLLYGLAAWTRPEGIGFALTFLFALFLLARWLLKIRGNWKSLLRVGLPALILPGTWLFLVGVNGLGSDQVGGAMKAFLDLEGLFGGLGTAISQILKVAWSFLSNTNRAGLILPTGILLLAGPWILGRKSPSRKVLMLLALFLAAVMLPFSMFAVAILSEADFTAFLQQSLDRAMLPAITLLWLAASLAAGHSNASTEGDRQ